jgi:hypothetical protein
MGHEEWCRYQMEDIPSLLNLCRSYMSFDILNEGASSV